MGKDVSLGTTIGDMDTFNITIKFYSRAGKLVKGCRWMLVLLTMRIDESEDEASGHLGIRKMSCPLGCFW